MICRKATVAINVSAVMLSDTNFLPSRCQSLSSRAQNRHFCAFLGYGTPDFWLFEHKIGVFVLFWPSEPPFSGLSSTKSRFLCAFALRNPRFRAFRAQNRGFCARLRQARPPEDPVLPQEAHWRRSFATRITWQAQFRHRKPSGRRNLG